VLIKYSSAFPLLTPIGDISTDVLQQKNEKWLLNSLLIKLYKSSELGE
jgi:hypothetical protein